MYKFGTIVLIPFPFTDLTSSKVRPALIISKQVSDTDDVIVSFISSNQGHKGLAIQTSDTVFTESGLKVDSTIRFDKIATLHKRLILGELGTLPESFLQDHRDVFLDTFGF